MGDADTSLQAEPEAEFGLEHVSNVLDAIDENLTFFEDLEQRILQTWSPQIKQYIYFRNFFLVMNFILLPLVITIGLCYSVKQLVDEEMKVVLQAAESFLLYVTGSLGMLLYLGSLWTVYVLTLPLEEEASVHSESRRSEDDNASTGSTSEVSVEHASTNTTLLEFVEDEIQDSLFKKIYTPENNFSSNLDLESKNRLPECVPGCDEKEEFGNKEGEEKEVIPAQVDFEFKLQEVI